MLFCVCAFSIALASGARVAAQAIAATRSGVTFAVPAGLHPVPVPPTPWSSQVDHVYSDRNGTLQLWVVNLLAQPGGNSTAGDEAARRALGAGFAEGARRLLGGSEVGTLEPVFYDPEVGGYRVRARLTAPSLAHAFLNEAPASAAWQAVRQSGQDERLLRCFLTQLLAGKPAADVAQLRAHEGTAADSCGARLERVQRFVALSGERSFAARPFTLSALAIPTRHTTVAFYALGPRSGKADTQALLNELEAGLSIPEPEQLTLSTASGARLLGITLGALLAVLCFGGLGGWLFVRLRRWSARRALGVSLLALNALNAALLAWMWQPGAQSWIKLGAYGLGSALLYAPIAAWLQRRGRARGLWSEQGGLSTLEYALLFVLILIGAIAAWSKLGTSLDGQVRGGTEQFDSALAEANRRGSEETSNSWSTAAPAASGSVSTSGRPRTSGGPPGTAHSAASRPSAPTSSSPSSPSSPHPGSASAAHASAPSSSSAAGARPQASGEKPPSGSQQASDAPPAGILQRARDYLDNTPAAQYTLGLAAGVLQGFTPGGFIAPSPYASSKPFELGRGLGQMAAGISETVAGVGMMGGGGAMAATGAAATVTPASPGGIALVAAGVPTATAGAATAASGVASVAAGYGTFVNAMSMSDEAPAGGSSSSGSGNGGSSAGGGGGRPSPEIAQELLQKNGGSVTKALPELERMKLGQNKTIEVIQQMYKSSGRGSFVQTQADGAKVLLSRRIGPHQPVLVVNQSGQVTKATATIEVTGVLDPPMRAVDIVY